MYGSPYDLTGKVVVVTGAGRGIGRAIAIGFSKANASICCTARTKSEINETCVQIAKSGGKSVAIVSDVRDYESVAAVFETTREAFGGIDIVVVNAGVSGDKWMLEKSEPSNWKATIEINLIGAFHTAKACIPHLRRRGGGKIIFVGSGLGHRGVPQRSSYACSKAGVWMLTRVLAQELLPYKISVNELVPGPVQTALLNGQEDDFLARVGKDEWIKKPEDVVDLALFLATQPEAGPTAQSFSLMRRDW